MKTLKVLLQEVVSGIKAWVNSNFAQESNAVHKTGNETVNGVKTFTGSSVIQNASGSAELKLVRTDINLGDAIPEANKTIGGIAFTGTNGAVLGYMDVRDTTTGDTFIRILARQKYDANGNRSASGTNCDTGLDVCVTRDSDHYIAPVSHNTCSLGTSAKQWRNLYAKNYFYNGTAWGLDKQNEWTGVNTFVGNIGLVTYKSNEIDRTQHTDSNWKFVTQIAQDKNGKKMGECYWGYKASTDEAVASFWVTASDGLDNDTSHRGGIYIFHNGSTGITDVHPAHLNGTNLGTSTNKWKTFNGVNPGALSFPNYSDTTYIDISGSIVPPTGETGINKNLESNYYTPPIDGWLSIRCDGAEYVQVYRNSYNCPGVTAGDGTASVKLVVTLPVRKNVTYTIRIKKTINGTEYYQLYPCLGNV